MSEPVATPMPRPPGADSERPGGVGGAGERPGGVGVLAALAVAWLVATLWAAYATMAGAPSRTSIAVAQAAITLPTAVAASVLAGTAAGLLCIAGMGRLPRARLMLGYARLELTRPGSRALLGAAGALPIGLLCVLAVVLAYGGGRFIITIAATVGLAALLGGALCAVRPLATVAAGLTGALAALAIGLAVGLVKSALAGRLADLFGAGDTAASQLNADATLQLTVSVLSGLAAGLTAFWFLHRSRAGLRWWAYLTAGGSAGLLLLTAEATVRLGGARLFSVVAATSPADRAVLDYLGSQRLNHALVVFFVGAVVALVAVGRTLPAKVTNGGQVTDDGQVADDGQKS